jgi:hypothetical protein
LPLGGIILSRAFVIRGGAVNFYQLAGEEHRGGRLDISLNATEIIRREFPLRRKKIVDAPGAVGRSPFVR